MKRKKVFCLAACLLLSLCFAASALAQDAVMGQPNMLLTATSGLGSVSAESTLGCAAADAVRMAAGSDFAVVCGGDLVGNLEPKPLRRADIAGAFADGSVSIGVTELTAAELKEMLENAVSHIVLDSAENIDRKASAFGDYLQISGFALTYDASARPGERVMQIVTPEGKLELSDRQTVYTLAAPEPLLQGLRSYAMREYTPLASTLTDAMVAFVERGTPDDYTGHDRITEVGCSAYNLVNHYPIVICVIAACILWTAGRLWRFQAAGKFER